MLELMKTRFITNFLALKFDQADNMIKERIIIAKIVMKANKVKSEYKT